MFLPKSHQVNRVHVKAAEKETSILLSDAIKAGTAQKIIRGALQEPIEIKCKKALRNIKETFPHYKKR